MNRATSIRIEELSKRYKLGLTHKGSIRELVNGWTRTLLRTHDRDLLDSERTKHPKPNSEFWALQEVSLDVARGEVLGIIGRNGAGKSTLLKILSQVTSPTKGQVRLIGRVGSLLEVGTGFHPELTGRENVFMNGTILGMKRAEIRRKFDDIVEFSGVEPFIDTPVKRYSTGMTVRLGFAVAAHLEPEILIVDEVLAVGDLEFQNKCLGKMEQVSAEGRTILFVSHNMGAVRTLCSRVILLEQGRLVDDGDPAAVIDRYAKTTDTHFANRLPSDDARVGTGEARIREVQSEKQAAGHTAQFLMGEPVEIRLVAEVFERVPNAHAQVCVKALDGTTITCSETTSPPYHPNTLEIGNVTIQAKIDARLLPGSYRVSATIYRGNGRAIDVVDDAMSFTVDKAGTEDGDYFRWEAVNGFVRPETSWKFAQDIGKPLVPVDTSHSQ